MICCGKPYNCRSCCECCPQQPSSAAEDDGGNLFSKLKLPICDFRCSHTRIKWRVTVEPVVFLYMLPTFMLLPVLQDLIYTKVCLSLYSESICNHLNSSYNKAALNSVQAQSAHWIQASTIMMCLPAMVVGQLLGTYSDVKGRKMPLIVPPLGGVLASLVYVLVSSRMLQLDVSWILLASFLTGLGGGYAACLNTAASYLTQISPVERRTPRVGAMEGTVVLGACIGPLLVGTLQETYGREKVFTLMLALHAANVLYVLAAVPNVHASHTVSRLSPSERCPPPTQPSTLCQGLLAPTWRRLKAMLGVVFRPRQEHRRSYLLLLLLAAAVIMFCTVGQLDILYLYLTDRPLSWSLVQYTHFSALSSALGLLSLVLVMVPLSRVAGDSLLLLIGSCSRLVSLVVLGAATSDALVYSVAVAGCASSWCLPSLRSAMSKLVEPDELGRVFGVFGIVELSCTLLATSVFTSLYPVTRQPAHGAVFWGAAAVMIVPVVIAAYVYRPLRHLDSYTAMSGGPDDDLCCDAPQQHSPEELQEEVAQVRTQDDPELPTQSQQQRPAHTATLSLNTTTPLHNHSSNSFSRGGAVSRPPPGRSISLSSNSSASSVMTPITPISPTSSIGSAAEVAGPYFPAIVDTNFSNVTGDSSANVPTTAAVTSGSDTGVSSSACALNTAVSSDFDSNAGYALNTGTSFVSNTGMATAAPKSLPSVSIKGIASTSLTSSPNKSSSTSGKNHQNIGDDEASPTREGSDDGCDR